jgi:hypothetical protein
MDDLKRIEPKLLRATTSQRPLWRIVRGPVGTGSCLASEDPAGGVLFLAPPGVALQRPEEAAALMGWRRARWQHGALQDRVVSCTLKELEELAPANRAWIQERMREDERLDLMLARARGVSAGDQTIADAPGVVSVAAIAGPAASPPSESVLLPDRRRVAVVTHSASTYSALTHRLPSSSAVAQVETFVVDAVSASHLATELDTLSLTIGVPAVRELVVSLLHARTRSHSWRYTRFLSRLESRSAHERRLARLVADSKSARDLLESLGAQEELDEILVNLLYAQHHGMRWRVTYPLRRTLGSPRLEGCRGVLRNLAVRRSSRMKALPPAHPSG